MPKEIILTKGYVALVDDEDYENLMQWKWSTTQNKKPGSKPYARYNGSGGISFFMHNIVIGFPPIGMVTDHKNRNTLDNRRENLRFCTQQQNLFNRIVPPHRASIYRGVKKSANRWTAAIGINGKRIHLGSFKTPEEAALSYNEAALKYHGEFAVLNTLKEI